MAKETELERRTIGYRLLLAAGASALALSLGTTAFAQDASAPAVEEVADEEVNEEEDAIIVTGSLIKQSTFSSISPLQVIGAEVIREVGLSDVQKILARTTVVQGTQIDQGISQGGFVTDNGPGASSVGLRGLGSSRTLFMVNGRRLAPGGVEGLPTSPDISQLPTTMIKRVEILLDGASSIYGSDAVTGVINVFLRDDFEGLEIDGFTTFNQEDGGNVDRVSMIFGDQGERGGFTIAAEYFQRNNLLRSDASFVGDGNVPCQLDIEVATDGTRTEVCQGLIGNVVFNPAFGFVGFTPGQTNIGVDNFTAGVDTSAAAFRGYGLGFPLEGSNLVNPSKRTNVYFSGHYDLNVLNHMEFYSEVAYNNRRSTQTGRVPQLFPTVPGSNPFNPFGRDVTPVVFLKQRQGGQSEVDQTRLVAGLRGDFALGNKWADRWSYDLNAQYSRGRGTSVRPVAFESAIVASLLFTEDDGNGGATCNVPNLANQFGFLDNFECVPLNFFATSLYTDGVFETQEENDFVNQERLFNTTIEQSVLHGTVTGPLFNLPWQGGGEVNAAFGLEYRKDRLISEASTVSELGLAAGLFADPDGGGQVDLFEAFGEIDIPVMRDMPAIQNLSLNFQGRYLDHEFFGSDYTYTAKLGWNPIESLLLRVTNGRSFRAPNARELFLQGQTGFASGLGDPCVVPVAARDGSGNYDPSLDNRSQTVIGLCQADGVDPFSLGLGGTPSIQTSTGGNTGLNPETSQTWTVGGVFKQNFSDEFDFSFGVNYFNYKVKNTVAELSVGDVLGQCFNQPRQFCDRFNRDPQTGFIDILDNSPVNIGIFTSKGIDFNTFFGKDFTVSGQAFSLTVDSTVTYQEEQKITIIAASDDNAGEYGTPKWRATNNVRLAFNDFSVFWQSRYIKGTQPDITTGTTLRDTFGDDVVRIPDLWYHDISINYTYDTWLFRLGVNDVFSKNPPLVSDDAPATLDAQNVPLGAGINTVGRSIFANFTKAF